MADVTLTYKNNKIFETSSSTSETIETGGKYCTNDLILDYDNPLPTLNNPATSGDIRSGYDAGGSSGEVINGSIPDYAGQTDTGTVIPVDTGANGLYKKIVQGTTLTGELKDANITKMGDYVLYGQSSINKISLPNLTSMGGYALYGCSGITGIVDVPIAGNSSFYDGLSKTCKVMVDTCGATFSYRTFCQHCWFPNLTGFGANLLQTTSAGRKSLKTVQFDNLTSFPVSANFTNTFIYQTSMTTCILRMSTVRSIPKAFPGNFAVGGTGLFYVPASLLTDYSTATNWSAYYAAGQIIGINEDTTIQVGDTFTPTTTDSTITHWDKINLQTYTAGTFDTTTGELTATHDGRYLIRGLDADDAIKHCAYVMIGEGLDEVANLAS